jgi:membrane associated rhomboid family serine protease/TolA-binding protein
VFFFLPLGTTRPCWRTPYLTYGLLVANVIVFIVQSAAPGSLPTGFVPAHPSLFAWLASLFMHAGLLHLGGNMLFLWLFGTIAEDVLGPGLFALFYLAGAVGATGLDALMGTFGSPADWSVPRLGASGAIAGIMGLAAVCFTRTKVRVWYFLWWMLTFRMDVAELGAPLFIGLWVGWELLQGMVQSAIAASGGVAHWAHVGGFAAGLAGALLLRLNKRVPRADLVSGRIPVLDQTDAYQQAGELQQMVMQSPEDADAWYALGRDYEMSARLNKAKEAYEKAVFLFLKQHRVQEAAKAYAAVVEYGLVTGLTPDQEFDLACALEEAGSAKRAFGLFRKTVVERPEGDRAETALMRAAEIARTSLGDYERAAECYRKLLDAYPYSNWRALAQERLRDMGVPEKAPAPESPATPAAEPDSDLRPLSG